MILSAPKKIFENLKARNCEWKKKIKKEIQNPIWPHLPCENKTCTVCERVRRFDMKKMEADAKAGMIQ